MLVLVSPPSWSLLWLEVQGGSADGERALLTKPIFSPEVWIGRAWQGRRRELSSSVDFFWPLPPPLMYGPFFN